MVAAWSSCWLHECGRLPSSCWKRIDAPGGSTGTESGSVVAVSSLAALTFLPPLLQGFLGGYLRLQLLCCCGQDGTQSATNENLCRGFQSVRVFLYSNKLRYGSFPSSLVFVGILFAVWKVFSAKPLLWR
ncbi:hypothetical protein CHARACLAT_033274 [Characodon lateralis]|uniref:Uncharacterized protein n=1 Tax=Characodon lateralis TaxID=208331 RepID=A0ABU7DQT8_9TELE|nr:hypothetical protein [Characodon lateralis]